MKDFSNFILNKINEYYRGMARESHNTILGDSCYEYYQCSLKFTYDAIQLIKEREVALTDKKFLDVGSGMGYICGLVSHYDLICEGIELNPVLCNISKEIFTEVKFHNVNIINFDEYQNYDVIYYYLPFNDIKLHQELKEKIENSVRVGTYIIAYGEEEKDDRFISIDDNDNHIKNQVWLKIK